MPEWVMPALLCALLIVDFILLIVKFYKQPNSAKIESVKAWLLTAVCAAEKEFGAGTGAIKLSSVYEKFITTFPAIAAIVTFETFSSWVDEVLERFKAMLSTNNHLQEYVNPTNTQE